MQGLPRKRTVFLSALLIGASVVLLPAAWSAWTTPSPTAATQATASPAFAERHRLSEHIWVAGQIHGGDIAQAKALGFRTVIALRPDGEAPDQSPSAEMSRLAQAQGLAFGYVPVPQGELPDAVADALGATLARAEGPILLYCRSGRRAARAWALAEASRVHGLAPDRIRSIAADAGHPVDDLSDRLMQRFVQRGAAPRG